jgi:hypothetical protein
MGRASGRSRRLRLSLLAMVPTARRAAALSVIVLLVGTAALHGQRGGRGGSPPTPREAAAIDLTGYWVSVVTEDWKLRMVTPKKDVFDALPLNAEGRRVGNLWDPARDEAAGEQCKVYGAGGLMRLPGRVHITWQDANALKVELMPARRRDSSGLARRRHQRANRHGKGSRSPSGSMRRHRGGVVAALAHHAPAA